MTDNGTIHLVMYDKSDKMQTLIYTNGRKETWELSAFSRNIEHLGYTEITKDEYEFFKEIY